MNRALPVAVLVVVILLFAGGSAARSQLSIDFSMEGIEGLRSWVQAFGWLGPTVFVSLVTFRSFLLLPSALLLLLGGLAFGAAGGTALGAAGLLVSGLMQFGAARVLGNEWVRPRLGEQGRRFEARINRAGPWVVALATGHPVGPMTALNLAAGVSSMSLVTFTLVVLLAGPVRAGSYALLGASVLEWGLLKSTVVGLVLGALALAPFLHPRVRAWVVGD
jgi:uncharacterized membrane protein YdjX (TVP38/TMEM64 family)